MHEILFSMEIFCRFESFSCRFLHAEFSSILEIFHYKFSADIVEIVFKLRIRIFFRIFLFSASKKRRIKFLFILQILHFAFVVNKTRITLSKKNSLLISIKIASLPARFSQWNFYTKFKLNYRYKLSWKFQGISRKFLRIFSCLISPLYTTNSP